MHLRKRHMLAGFAGAVPPARRRCSSSVEQTGARRSPVVLCLVFLGASLVVYDAILCEIAAESVGSSVQPWLALATWAAVCC